jgi:arabinogalactan endo-1,4-beta-galactosidase
MKYFRFIHPMAARWIRYLFIEMGLVMQYCRIGEMKFKAALFLCCLLSCATLRAADLPFITGADVSMLPTIEKTGGKFSDDGKPGDAIQILAAHGCNLFRVRLFVNPDPDYVKNFGAVQSLDYVRGLAKRIKATGQIFLLDIHYSDTWADPGKQYTPADWKKLDFDAMKKQVHDYTIDVLKTLQADGNMPDMVQVGNEITAGVLWPTGQILFDNVSPDKQVEQWQHFAELISAGCKAVRESQTPDHPIRIMIHIHGGGKEGMAKYFWNKFKLDPSLYDIVGLSFYPAWEDSIDYLKGNLVDAIQITGKDVILAETSYPWKELPDKKGLATLQWPQTPEGQKQYFHDLTATLRAAPGGHGKGYIYWYPEAIPTHGLRSVWRQGFEALFDQTGGALPALESYGQGG